MANPPVRIPPNGATSSMWKFAFVNIEQGKPKNFKKPQDLAYAVYEYFLWAEKHPFYETKAMVADKEIHHVEIPKVRAMTISGLCLFLGIDFKVWLEYKNRSEYSPICVSAESAIREQKFGAAAAGLLHPIIIARDLGLVDRIENPSAPTTVQVNVIQQNMTNTQAAELWADTLRDVNSPKALPETFDDEPQDDD